ncbi:MAG: hypothetical protein ACD_73C00085G0001, partial [uncultured bacterium]
TGSGGGITNAGDNSNLIQIQNSILINSSGTGQPDCNGPVTSLGNNIISDPTGCTLTAGNGDLSNIDPLLDAFTDNLTTGDGHFPLLPTSPAANRANPDICSAQDQLAANRIAVCDIGAVEASASCRDGIIQNNEQCDDGNNIDTDSCLSNCQTARCGDGFIQASIETCDDSNTTDLDGCSASCIVETTTTGGSDTTNNNDGDTSDTQTGDSDNTDTQTGTQNGEDTQNNAEGTADNSSGSSGGGGCSLSLH